MAWTKERETYRETSKNIPWIQDSKKIPCKDKNHIYYCLNHLLKTNKQTKTEKGWQTKKQC